MELHYRIGDVRDRLAEIPDGSIDLVVTSPPFIALRSYLPADHPDKHREIGSEPTPAAFLDTMLGLTAEFRRVLAPHGSICIELGDTYSGKGGENNLWTTGYSGGRLGNNTKKPAGGVVRDISDGWPLAKSLIGIPTLYTWSLAYGRNLLTGDESPAGRWRIRNLIVWARANPPVGALGDKFRPSTSYITVACVGQKRWFDLDAVRTEHKSDPTTMSNGSSTARAPKRDGDGNPTPGNPAGAPPLDWHSDIDDGPNGDRLWWLNTQPYAGSHYATFPEELPRRLIEAMCPREVCRACGKARERITERTPEYAAARAAIGDMYAASNAAGRGIGMQRAERIAIKTAENVTLGWTDCGHDNYRPGVVLDPFAGSGTTLAVALGLGRSAIGIDIDARNAELARERCGMFLEVQP